MCFSYEIRSTWKCCTEKCANANRQLICHLVTSLMAFSLFCLSLSIFFSRAKCAAIVSLHWTIHASLERPINVCMAMLHVCIIDDKSANGVAHSKGSSSHERLICILQFEWGHSVKWTGHKMRCARAHPIARDTPPAKRASGLTRTYREATLARELTHAHTHTQDCAVYTHRCIWNLVRLKEIQQISNVGWMNRILLWPCV